MKKYIKPVITEMDAYIEEMLCVSLEVTKETYEGEFSEKNDDDFNAW